MDISPPPPHSKNENLSFQVSGRTCTPNKIFQGKSKGLKQVPSFVMQTHSASATPVWLVFSSTGEVLE